jgi:hypothetical protein
MLRTLRKLVLGETWALPIGIAVAVGAAAVVSTVAGSSWWHDNGGFVLLALLVGAFVVSLRIRR